MSPLTHFLGSWLVASVTTDNPRDRKLVTLAGVLPDADGLGLVADVVESLASGKEIAYNHYQQYHHLLLHGWPGAIAVSSLLALFARKRTRTGLMCLFTYHLHLLCDLLGSRGPSSADLWPICYSEPLFRHPIWFWKGQWPLDGWQNQVISVALLVLSLWLAAKQGSSFMEFFGRRLDKVFVDVLRKWRNRFLGRGPMSEPGG
jgi:ABC-type cobalamin transport system permease subunit